MMNEELAGTIPATAGLTETETLGGVGAVGQVGTVELPGQLVAPPDADESTIHGPMLAVSSAPEGDNALIDPAPVAEEAPELVDTAGYDVPTWDENRSRLTTIRVNEGLLLDGDTYKTLRRARRDGLLAVAEFDPVQEMMWAHEKHWELMDAGKLEQEIAEAEASRQEKVWEKFGCMFEDRSDPEVWKQLDSLFDAADFYPDSNPIDQHTAIRVVAEALYGDCDKDEARARLRDDLGLADNAPDKVVYGRLKEYVGKRKEAKIEHAKMQAAAEALAGEIEKVMSISTMDAEYQKRLAVLDSESKKLKQDNAVPAWIGLPGYSQEWDKKPWKDSEKQVREKEEERKRVAGEYDKARSERWASLLKGDVLKKVEAMIDNSELPWEAKYAIREQVNRSLDGELKNEFWRQFKAGKKPKDFSRVIENLGVPYKSIIQSRIDSEYSRYDKAKEDIARFDKELEAEYQARRQAMAHAGSVDWRGPSFEKDDFNPVYGKKEMKARVWAAKQLNFISRKIAKLGARNADAVEVLLDEFVLEMQGLDNNKFLSKRPNLKIPDSTLIELMTQIGELGLDVGTVIARGAGSVYDLVTDALPGSDLTLEERKIRQRLFDSIRAAQLKPGSLAWGSETMGGKLRQGIVQAAGSTLTFASTYGIGTVLSVWDDEANRLMAEGAGFWSAHARGLAAGGVEYATENLGGLTMGSFKAAQFGARVGSRAAGAAVRPLTKWGKMQRFIEAPLIAKAAAVKSLFTPAEGMLTKAAGYMAAGRVAWNQKKYGSAALRTGAAWMENTLEEAFEEVVGDVAGVPLDRLLARLFGDPLETIASDDGMVRPWYAETARRAWGTFTDPGLWAGVVVLGAAGAGLNVGRYTREAAISSMDAEHIRAAVGCTWREALRIARIKDPAKRLPEIGKMAVIVKTECDAGKRTRESVHGNMVEGLRAWALADDGLRSLDIYDDLVAQGKLPEFKKLDKNRYLVKIRDEEGKIVPREMTETALVKHLGNQMMAGVAAEISASVEAGAKNAMIGELRKDPRFVVQEGDAGAHYDELVRRYNASKKLIEMGRSLDEVVPEVDADRALGDVLAESPEGYKERAWLEWQRDTHLDPREANDKEAFEASFAKGQFDAPAMNDTLRYGANAGKVFLRFVKGKAGLKDVLEELVEAGFKSGRFDYVQQGELLRALQEQTGLQGQFMTQEGEFGVGNVIEGISKLALSDVMANPDFYAMPTWMKDAVRTLRQFNMDALDLCKLGAKVAEMHEEGLLSGSLMENVHALMGDAVGYFKGVANVAQSSAMRQAAVAAVTAADAPALVEAGLQDVSGMRESEEDRWVQDLTLPEGRLSDDEVRAALKDVLGRDLVNDETGIVVRMATRQREKMLSSLAKRKSVRNGFSHDQHNHSIVAIESLFRNASLLSSLPDSRKSPHLLSVKRFASPVIVGGRVAVVYLTVKETLQHGNKLYSLELMELKELAGSLERQSFLDLTVPTASSGVDYAGFQKKVKLLQMEIEALGGSLRSVSPEGTDSATPSAGNILARFREIVKGNVKGAEYADNAVTAPEQAEQDAEDLNDLMEEAMTGKTREERDREAAEKTMAALGGGEKPDSGHVPVDKLELPQKRPAKRKRAEGDILFGSRAEAAPVQVWVRKDGRLEVIGELHRQEDETVPCEFHYEADGFDEAAGLLLDAEMNIRYGIGSAIDFARYCRETGVTKADALARGWFGKRQGDGVRIGIYGSESLYQAFLDGKIGERQAAKIAQAAPGNDALQRMGVREVVDRKKTADYAVAVMQAAVAQENGAPIEADAAALNEARKMAEYATRMKKALRKMIDSAKGAINDPENFAAVTKSKVKDTEGAMLTLANLTAALKRWENFAVHPELAAEARAWDGKSRVTVEADALPPAIEPPAYAMNITPETAETLESLQEMAEGKDIVIHNAEYGNFAFEWGRIGREKDGKGGMGLLHMIYQRVLNGFSVQEAARTAVLASIAAQEGTLNEVRMNKHLFEKYGVRAVVAFDEDTRKKIITGFVITSIKQPKQAVDEGAAHMSRQLYAQTTLNRRDVVGAAMKEAIAWYEDIVKMYPQDYDKVLSGYVAWLKRKQEAKVRGEAVPPEMEAPSYAMNISPETAETLESLQEMAGGKDIVIRNAEYGDFAFEWGRIGRGKDGKGGMGLEHIFHKRLQHGFTLEETARIAVLASMAAQNGKEQEPYRNVHRFDLNGVRAAVAFNAKDSRKIITGFVVTNEKNVKGAVDADAAKTSRQFYASEALNRRQLMGAALNDAIAWYEDIVKMYPQDYDKVLSGYVVSLKLKQEAKVRKREESSPESTVSYSIIGPHAQTWSRYADKVFTGRDDGMERVEIDASQSSLRQAKDGQNILRYYYERVKTPRPERKGKYLATLGHILQFPELYEAYPWLKNTYVHGYNDAGDVSRGIAFTDELPGSISLNFAHLAQAAPFEGIIVDERDCRSVLLHEVQHLIAAEEGYEPGGNLKSARNLLPDSELSDYEIYLRLAGEIESRNVQSRMLMSRQHRAAVPFNETLEFPWEAINTDRLNPSYAMRLTSADVCRTRQEARAKVGRKGKPIPLENSYLQLEAEFSAKSERKFSHDDSIGRTFTALKDSGLSDEEIKTAHYSAYGNIVKLFANGERMEFERAYKKKEERKGFLHVYSPFEMEGSDRQYEADIELMIHRKGGQKPTAYLLNVSIQERPQAIETGDANEGSSHLAVLATEDIQSDFPEIVKPQAQEPGYSMRWLGGKQVREALAPERGNLAMSWLIDDMVKAVNKVGELGNILHLSEDNDREKYINAVHDVTGKFLALRMALPEKWRPSIDRDLKYLRKYMELAMRGEVDLTAESDWDTWKIIQNEFGRDAKETEELLKELGRDKAHKQVEKILGRIKNKMEKWGKWQIRQQAERLFRMAKPQVDLVTKKQKRGLMDAASVYRVKMIQELWGMSAGTWKSIMKEMADSMHDNDEASSEWLLLQTFGSFERMSLNDAVRALEELKKFVRTARTEWDEKLDAKRGDLARLSDEIIETVERPTAAEIHENNKKPKAWKRVKGIPADLQNIAQAYAHMRAVGLGVWGDNLQRRMINASRWIQQARDERMAEMDAHVRRLGFKSWGKFVKWMHESGEIKGLHAVASPVLRRREVSHANAYRMRGLSGAELKQALADADLNEDDWKELLVLMQSRDEMVAVYEHNLKHWEAQDKASKQGTAKPSEPKEMKDKSFVILRDVGEVEESIPRLTHGQALYIILMSEQPRYYQTRTDKDGNIISEGTLPAHGWDDANIKALKDYVGENGLEMGYIMRRLLQEQGEILREVYEDEYGVPFPQEENYFPARFLHPEGGETLRDKIMREYMGLTPNSTSWQKMRVDHKRAVDTNTDALSVFVKTSMMVDNWLHTHTITQDIDAVLKAEGAGDAIKNAIGPQDYRRFVDFSQILKNAIVLDLSGTAAVESWVKRGLSSYARATLSYRIETLLRQMPAIMNGYIGSDGSVTLHEYLQTMWHLKKGKARMGYRKMLASAAMQERMRGDYGNMVRQALNEEDMPTVADTLVDWGMKGMEKTDAWATAFSMVPVWNIYFERAKTDGMSDEEAEAQAWAAVDDALARGAQPNGVFHKSLFAGSDNAFVRSLGYMLSEEWCKTGQIVSLWKSGARMKAFNSWMIYGGFNALMMYLLDLLRYDDDEKEKRHWWDYFVSALYGPLAGVPVIGQMAAGCVNYLVNSLGGNLHTGAGGAQAVINTDRFLKDVGRFFTMASNDKHYDFRDWTYATGNLFKGIGAGTFAATNWRGSSWFILAAALVNPVKTIANAKHAWFD